jgi:hypothetical protein
MMYYMLNPMVTRDRCRQAAGHVVVRQRLRLMAFQEQSWGLWPAFRMAAAGSDKRHPIVVSTVS